MTDRCIFCRVGSGEVASDRVFEDDDLVVIRDIAPVAPHHLLVIPRAHIPSLNDLTVEVAPLLGSMILAAASEARNQGIAQSGYRLVANCGAHAGQSIEHLHIHVIGGRELGPIG